MAEMQANRPSTNLKWTMIAAASVFALILIVGSVVRRAKGSEVKHWTEQGAIPTVAVLEPDQNTSAQNLKLPGTLRAYYSAQIYSRVPGYVHEWRTDIGAAVRKGDVLALIDTPELDQQIDQARADLDMSRSAKTLSDITAQRWGALLPLDAVSKQAAQEKAADVDAKSSAVHAASANLRRLMAMKEFGRIVAPFDGIVTTRSVDVGALVSGGSTSGAESLFTVSQVGRLRVYINVPQSYSAQITHEIKAVLQVPEYPGKQFPASLVSTSNAINAESGTLLVELRVDNPDGVLKPGGYAEIDLNLPPNPGRLTLPASALLFRAEGLQVATLDSANHIVMRSIRIARDLGSKVEVESGVSAHDRIVDNPPDSLSAGDAVQLVKPGSDHDT